MLQAAVLLAGALAAGATLLPKNYSYVPGVLALVTSGLSAALSSLLFHRTWSEHLATYKALQWARDRYEVATDRAVLEEGLEAAEKLSELAAEFVDEISRFLAADAGAPRAAPKAKASAIGLTSRAA
jgi:hypothetical protein